MAIYPTLYPVVDIDALEKELKLQFNVKINVDDDLRDILFYGDYMNDCYKSYYFADDEKYTGESWQNEEHIRIRNLVNTILRNTLPEHHTVLIDVMW